MSRIESQCSVPLGRWIIVQRRTTRLRSKYLGDYEFAPGLWLSIILLGGALFFPLFDSASAASADGPHAGFFYDRHELSLETGWRTEIAGPFFYNRQSELAHTWAFPPFFSYTDWLDGEACEYDIAYPLLTYDRFGSVYRWQLCQLLAFAGGDDQAETARKRFTLFPFYFQQRSPDPNQNYTAVFPFYGHLQNRLFRSEMDFVLWPIYLKTVKRPSAGPAEEDLFINPLNQWLGARRGDVTTHNFLLPFFHLRYGDGLFGWQAWPLLGHEHKDVTTKTNTWGDAEQIPGHDKRFVLWPIYHQQQRDIGGANPEHELLVFPFYNRLRSPLRDSTSYLTPFGVTITDDRARKYQEVDAPWPFVAFAWGEGKTTRRIWPFFSQAHTKDFESNFYLWPAYTYRRKLGETLDLERTRSFYFLFSHTKEKNTETGATKSRTDLWPLFTHQRSFDGSTRLQLLAPLEPLLPASKSIERNYSPLWSIWRSEDNPRTGARSQSLLWNFYRGENLPAPAPTKSPLPASAAVKRNMFSFFSADSLPGLDAPTPPPASVTAEPLPPATRKVSLLFGLFQYESTGANRRWRLFYLPLNSSQKVPQHVPEHR